jgi:hypothetical protein
VRNASKRAAATTHSAEAQQKLDSHPHSLASLCLRLPTRCFFVGLTAWLLNVAVFVHQTAIQATGFRFLEDAEKVRPDETMSLRSLRTACGLPF